MKQLNACRVAGREDKKRKDKGRKRESDINKGRHEISFWDIGNVFYLDLNGDYIVYT